VTTVCVPTEAAREQLDGLGADVLVWDWRGPRPAGFEQVEFLVPSYMGPPPPDSLDGLSRLRVVQLLSAGYDLWQPLIPDGVTLCNGRGIHGGSTAELAVGGLIALRRGLAHFLDEQRAERWDQIRTDGLDGARVLVLGVGDIGGRIATAVGAFGAQTSLVGHTAREGVHALAEVRGLLPHHDVVVIALPLNDDTRHLVDAGFLAALPDGAALVNIARGAIVDTDALLAELNRGRLRAFLDVTDPEPLPAGHPLWHAPNLLLTPHVGGGTRGWERRAQRLMHDQLQRYLAGEELLNRV